MLVLEILISGIFLAIEFLFHILEKEFGGGTFYLLILGYPFAYLAFFLYLIIANFKRIKLKEFKVIHTLPLIILFISAVVLVFNLKPTNIYPQSVLLKKRNNILVLLSSGKLERSFLASARDPGDSYGAHLAELLNRDDGVPTTLVYKIPNRDKWISDGGRVLVSTNSDDTKVFFIEKEFEIKRGDSRISGWVYSKNGIAPSANDFPGYKYANFYEIKEKWYKTE